VFYIFVNADMKNRHAPPRAVHGFTAPARFLGIPVLVDMHTHIPAQAKGLWPFKRIVLGQGFFYLGLREKEAVLHHEACHCRRFHLERRLCAIPLLLVAPRVAEKIAIEHELEADRAAVHRGFGAELLRVLHKLHGPGGQFHPSTDTRAAAINETMKEMHA
jgi:hypothetical protein